ncbi:hypothetical protein Tsubulata_020306 [Turnera subulata]|uniref:Glutaredoxin domain-containing protein n=1 Tax=Turnera subulata TaxID=218843 RepID=A0A9Q0G850_9ROSI|nr:hypothetical protein Tsubulata_020306 [Turnera subulata]
MSMKERFLKKLNFIPNLGTLKQGRLVSQLNSTETLLDQNLHHLPPSASAYIKEDQKTHNLAALADKIHESKHLAEEALLDICEQLKIASPPTPNHNKLDIAADAETPSEAEKQNEEENPLSLTDFEEKCPPGGKEAVILYTTSLRSIRKTFEDCHSIRFLLESFKVMFYERDVSLHLAYREELWWTLGSRQIPPRLFIRGKYIGGADQVVTLHEQGRLMKLLEGIPRRLSTSPCTACANIRFLVCSTCNGSLKVVLADGNIRCPQCNENGLVRCPICTSN